MLLFLIFNIFSVYFASQALQESTLISQHSHNTVTPFNITYNALYSVLVVLGLHQLQQLCEWNSRQKILYTTTCHIGAIVFGLCGEFGPLRNFSITPGFWGRLSLEGKCMIVLLALIIFALVSFQGYRAARTKTCARQWVPWFVLGLVWFVLWVTLLKDHLYVHVHHALFAGFFSCWFSRNSSFDIGINGILTGIVIEGIDFYGIGELTLFIIDSQQGVFDIGLRLAWILSVIGLMFIIRHGPLESVEGHGHVLKKRALLPVVD